MRVYRGRGDDIGADREASERLVDRVAAEREPGVRVWRPHRHVAFGRRDANEDGYERARDLARVQGFPPVEREVGGRAVAYSGQTVAFARVVPIEDPRSGLTERYEVALADVRQALADLGVAAREDEPADSFCPGTHSLQADVDGRARKLAGLAQRVRTDVAVVAGLLVVVDHAEIAGVLDPVYEALGVSLDPDTVGSVALAGGERDAGTVIETVESALVGGESATVVEV